MVLLYADACFIFLHKQGKNNAGITYNSESTLNKFEEGEIKCTEITALIIDD